MKQGDVIRKVTVTFYVKTLAVIPLFAL
jgi:hypothetical protein